MILHTRYFETNSGRWKTEKFAELTAFYQQIIEADNAKIVLIKK
jgi:hypothetical protein